MPRQISEPLLQGRCVLAASIAVAFSLAAPMAFANTIIVSNCNDSGAGSLRSAIAAAANNDTVDMSGLTTSNDGCSASTITLTTGDIAFGQSGLTIKGPGMTKLTVTGKSGTSPNYQVEPHRIFTSTYANTTKNGQWTLEDFSITSGYETTTDTDALGGCVYSAASLYVDHMNIHDCTARSSGSRAKGGAVYAKGILSITYSNILNSAALSKGGTLSAGGGVYGFAMGIKYSTVSGNTASAISGQPDGSGGGISTSGTTYIFNSTISNNSSDENVGGIDGTGANTRLIVNSTISGNVAGYSIGGAYLAGQTHMYNSTIAFNTAGIGNGAAGVVMNGQQFRGILLKSNLIANNTYGGSTIPSDLLVQYEVSFTGDHNFIFAPVQGSALPDTIIGKCPLLGSLRDNGGLTKTIALESHSPAIDQGAVSNVTYGPYTLVLNEDQRGAKLDTSPYPYPRVSGQAADIGAYEVQQDDIVFTSNLEGCP